MSVVPLEIWLRTVWLDVHGNCEWRTLTDGCSLVEENEDISGLLRNDWVVESMEFAVINDCVDVGVVLGNVTGWRPCDFSAHRSVTFLGWRVEELELDSESTHIGVIFRALDSDVESAGFRATVKPVCSLCTISIPIVLSPL